MPVRRRFVGSYGSPLRGTVVAGETASSSNSKEVDELNEALKALRDQEAMRKLAEGNPDMFLAYAKERIKELGTAHPNYAVWQDLIAKTELKLVESQWAADLESGAKTLEDFSKYLQDRIAKAKPGSAEATNLIKAYDANKKALIAREESKKDQEAVLDFVNTNDYDKYSQYLTSKLSRVTDPKVQSIIAGQIEELKARKEKAQQVARAQQVNDILTAYRAGGWDATKTIQALHHIAQTSPGITAAEVNSLNSAVASVFNEEEQRLKSARSAGTAQANTQATAMVDAAERAYARAESVIQYKVKYGVAVTTEDVNKLEAAESVLKEAYNSAARSTSDMSKADTWLTAAINLPEKTADTKILIDTAARKGVTPADVFADKLALAKGDPYATAELFDKRMRELGLALQKTNTPLGERVLKSELEEAAYEAAKSIKTLAMTKGKTDDSDLRRMWRAYQESDKPNTPVTSFDDFVRMVGMAKDVIDLEDLLGYDKGALPKGLFEQAKSAFDKSQTAPLDKDANKRAADAALKLVNNPFTPEDAVDPFLSSLAKQAGGSVIGNQYPDWFREKDPYFKSLQEVHGPGGARDPFAGEGSMVNPVMLPESQPITEQQQAPEQTQLDFLHGPGGARDPFADAYDYLESNTSIEFPGITVPELPAEPPYAPTFDAGFNFDSYFADPFGPGGPLENIHGDGGARDPFAGEGEDEVIFGGGGSGRAF